VLILTCAGLASIVPNLLPAVISNETGAFFTIGAFDEFKSVLRRVSSVSDNKLTLILFLR
jgi:hypothetical protein